MTTSSSTTVSSGTITPPVSGTADVAATKRFYGPSMKQSGALAMAGAPRQAKTLGWFMNDADIFDKKKQSSSDESNEKSRFVASSAAIGEEVKRKQKRLRKTMSSQGAARKDGYAASQAMSESSEEGYEEKRVNSLLADLTLTQASLAAQSSAGESDEYWFYDVATDGYYYEQNGAKGWRRRMPNSAVHKMKDQEVAHMNINGGSGKMNTTALAAQAAAAQAAFLHHALLHQQQQQQQQQQPTMRYYDPNSDGFYYEMASVDGWKRRQPNKPVSASVPAGITRPYAMRQAEQQTGMVLPPMTPSGSTSSYGAALARGQMPRNCVIDESSASSSICGDSALSDLLGGYDSYPSISRPSALQLDQQKTEASQPQKSSSTSQQINPNFNADRFIRDLTNVGVGGGSGSKFFGFQTTPSSTSWPHFRPCSVFNPSPIKSAAALEDELNMNNLLKDLDKIWAAPTPGVNQA